MTCKYWLLLSVLWFHFLFYNSKAKTNGTESIFKYIFCQIFIFVPHFSLLHVCTMAFLYRFSPLKFLIAFFSFFAIRRRNQTYSILTVVYILFSFWLIISVFIVSFLETYWISVLVRTIFFLFGPYFSNTTVSSFSFWLSLLFFLFLSSLLLSYPQVLLALQPYSLLYGVPLLEHLYPGALHHLRIPFTTL